MSWPVFCRMNCEMVKQASGSRREASQYSEPNALSHGGSYKKERRPVQSVSQSASL